MTSDIELMNETDLAEEKPYVQTEYDDGSVEIDFDEDSINAIVGNSAVNLNDEHFANLADDMEEVELNEIGEDVLDRYADDCASRADWLETVSSGLNLLGLELEEVTEPFPGACSAHHPLIIESAVKFQAKAANELFNAKGPIRTAIMGKITEEKEAQAKRVKEHMNYQIMYQMEEYFDETETLLFYLPIVGSGFKKIFYDGRLDRPVAQFVPVDRFVTNYYTTSLKTSPCYTHMIDVTANDLKRDMKNGMYRDVELSVSNDPDQGELELTVDEITGTYASSSDEVYTLLEQYCYLHLEDDPKSDEDEVALPYVVTVEKSTGTVLGVRRNWAENDPNQKAICPFTHYKFVPGLGFYGLGFIHLLGNLQMTLTTAMRNLVDSGAFATLQGGFVDKRLRMRNNDGPLAPGQFKEVEAGGLPLKDAIINLPFKEPSMVLLQMYQFIEARGQKFADSAEQVVSDSTNYGKVGTTMALLEASEKFFTGVHKRLHKAQKQEFTIIAALNHAYLEESETFDAVGNTFEVRKSDYDGRIDVLPVSDPNQGSHAQKMTQAQAIYTGAMQQPQIHDMREVSKYFYETIGIDEAYIDKFLPSPEEPEEGDPLTDLVNAQQGKPIKAFQGQDHDAHIAIKTAFLQDPASGANPAMMQLQPIVQANIQEHMMMKFRTQVAGTVASGEIQGDQKAIIIQAAQKVAQTNQRLAELEAQGPDTARNKLADAEMQRVFNETKKLESEIEDKVVKRAYDSLKIQMEKYAEDNKLLIAEMQTQAKIGEQRMKEMADLVKEAMKTQTQVTQQRETLTLPNKEEPQEPTE